MSLREIALAFPCAGDTLIGVLALPDPADDARAGEPAGPPPRVGVVIAVGGPQYRAGSHRQFVHLARHLAASGIPTLRFDYRGMGDSTGEPVAFDQSRDDIAAAIDALLSNVAGLQGVVLWGLCDAASAALIYWGETQDARVLGLGLANPWVRSAETYADTQVRHYYRGRVLSAAFWKKLIGGRIDVTRSAVEFSKTLRRAVRGRRGSAPAKTFQARMAQSAARFPGPMLVLLSENDYTAKEFLLGTQTDPAWEGVMARQNIQAIDIPGADHTLSTGAWRQAAERHTREWLKRTLGA